MTTQVFNLSNEWLVGHSLKKNAVRECIVSPLLMSLDMAIWIIAKKNTVPMVCCSEESCGLLSGEGCGHGVAWWRKKNLRTGEFLEFSLEKLQYVVG